MPEEYREPHRGESYRNLWPLCADLWYFLKCPQPQKWPRKPSHPWRFPPPHCLVIDPCLSCWVIQFQFPTLRKQRETAILRGSRLQICSKPVFLRTCITEGFCAQMSLGNAINSVIPLASEHITDSEVHCKRQVQLTISQLYLARQHPTNS